MHVHLFVVLDSVRVFLEYSVLLSPMVPYAFAFASPIPKLLHSCAITTAPPTLPLCRSNAVKGRPNGSGRVGQGGHPVKTFSARCLNVLHVPPTTCASEKMELQPDLDDMHLADHHIVTNQINIMGPGVPPSSLRTITWEPRSEPMSNLTW